MAKILIVEDEPALADLIQMNLRLVGHEVIHVDDGSAVMMVIAEVCPELIILDVMLPGKDGFALMAEIAPLKIPVIFLTAKDQLQDKIAGLRAGADDYMVKPFAIIELITRMDTVLKRYQMNGTIFRLDRLEVRLEEHLALLDGEPVELTTKEFALLNILIENRNIALSREQLLSLVWGTDFMGETRTIDVHIQKLRKKLSLEERIVTVYKVGYRLEVPR